MGSSEYRRAAESRIHHAWLFAPIFADGVTVWETNANGFVTQIDLLDTSNVFHTVFAGADPSLPGTPVGFTVAFASTAYEVKGVKVFVNPLSALNDWEEIDAVGLNGTFVPEPSTLTLIGLAVVSFIAIAASGDKWRNHDRVLRRRRA